MYDKERDDVALISEAEHLNRDDSSNLKHQPRLIIRKSFQSKNQKNNPVAYWKASNQKINAMQFSADGRFLAVVSEDGSLRILDYTQEKCDVNLQLSLVMLLIPLSY